MAQRNPAVDAYIAKAPAYAQPILAKIRALFHQADPAIEEAMKWNAPTFMHDGIVGSMAAFKEHIRFGFWKGKQLTDAHPAFRAMGESTMTVEKITALSDLPPDRKLIAMIKAAVQLNADLAAQKTSAPKKRSGASAAKSKKTKRTVSVPADLNTALSRNRQARATFDAFSYSHKKEYVEWITEAKRDETRAKRVAQTVEWLSEGKPRNWKYMGC